MVAILDHLHRYVPVCKQDNGEKEVYSPIPLAGDHMTAARAVTAKNTRVTCKGKGSLRGLVPFCADWHAKVNFIEVCYHCAWQLLYCLCS